MKVKSSLKLQVQSYKRLVNLNDQTPLSTHPTENQLLITRACWLLSSRESSSGFLIWQIH